MRPDGAVVIRHRVVAHRGRADGANAPTGEKFGAHEHRGHGTSVLFAGDAAIERVTGVGRADLALLFPAIERQGVGAKSSVPESRFETVAKRIRFPLEPCA